MLFKEISRINTIIKGKKWYYGDKYNGIVMIGLKGLSDLTIELIVSHYQALGWDVKTYNIFDDQVELRLAEAGVA